MHTYRMPFHAMASACEIVVAAAGQAEADAVARAAIDEVKRIEEKYSRYRADSIISRLNAAAGMAAVSCDAETLAMLGYADAMYRASDGLFDVTAGVLRRAWDFKNPSLPSERELDPLRALIGWPEVERENDLVRLPRTGMELDFGGFGKEYAADRAAAILWRNGARHGYVNLGGDLRVIGPKPDQRPWLIGIRHPRLRGKLLATIPISNGGLATSGDYERYFELGSKRYCHIIDPCSGQPVTFWRAVSVLAPLAVAAGNFATIAMLKQSDGVAFLAASAVSYLAVDQQGQIHTNTAS